jgi:serine/threonine-protein kinase
VASAHELAGRILLEVGCVSEAIAHLERARWLDPNGGMFQDLVRGYALLGDYDRADTVSATFELERHPIVLYTAARIQLWRRAPRALPEMDPSANPMLRKSYVDCLEVVRSGVLSDEALAFLDGRIAASTPNSRPTRFRLQVRAEFLAFVHRTEEAEATIARAVDGGLLDLAWMDRCPLLAELRVRPSFAGLRDIVEKRTEPVLRAWRGEEISAHRPSLMSR